MDPSTTPTERTYTVSWHRPDGEKFTCTHLSPRIAFARLWAAWKESGQITVTDIAPEWTTNSVHKTRTWPYPIPPPECEEGGEDWNCVIGDATGFFCRTCTLWMEENAGMLNSPEI